MQFQGFVDLLGYRVRDKVTGFAGVATSISFDLYGCVQAIVTPAAKDGEKKDGQWFDFHRLEKLPGQRVMDVPTFGLPQDGPRVNPKGPAEKPANSRY